LDQLLDVFVVANHIGTQKSLEAKQVAHLTVRSNLTQPELEFLLHLVCWLLGPSVVAGGQAWNFLLHEESRLHGFVQIFEVAVVLDQVQGFLLILQPHLEVHLASAILADHDSVATHLDLCAAQIQGCDSLQNLQVLITEGLFVQLQKGKELGWH
jgi:hypothetical protein